jgi:hypothetical protein
MTISRRIRVGVYCTAALVVAILGAPALADRRPECEQAADWVNAHKGRLPATLAKIAAFPRAYRHAIMGQLPADARATVWRARLSQISQRPLTSEQRRVVDDALRFLGPEHYVQKPTKQQLPGEWRTRAAAAFTGKSALLITELSDSEGTAANVEAALVLARRSWNRFSIAAANPTKTSLIPTCECNAAVGGNPEDDPACDAQSWPGHHLTCCGYGQICGSGEDWNCGYNGT